TELARQDEAVLAGHLGRLDEQHVAARPGDRQAGGHAGTRASFGRLLEEWRAPERVADLPLAERDRRLRSAGRNRGGGLPKQLPELPLELPNASLPGVPAPGPPPGALGD